MGAVMTDSISLSILEKELEVTSKKMETTQEAIEHHEDELTNLRSYAEFYNKKYADLKSAIDKLKI